ncbi:MAG TPA: DUF6457 domain-containing protein [Acidimicrobiales bacterium]|nr:DUF6457 domain-containing protein [Acidimicrobiales bacterium]
MTDSTESAEGFIGRFAAAAGIAPPSAADIETLLDTAGVAAHASERKAAPIVCWLVGRAGLSADEALETARRLAEEAPS